MDNYAALHSIIVRGVNKKLGSDIANQMIRKVFEERFGPDSVVQVLTVKNTDNI